MNSSSSKKTLSVTVGITTCFGDISILETVKSIRESRGISSFNFVIVADRVPMSNKIKKVLKKYDVRLIENKTEGGQVEKQRQILKEVKTDIVVFTQDDVLLHPDTLAVVLKHFQDNPTSTMVSIPYRPIESTSLFESVLNVGTNIVNKSVKHWNNGDNYLSSIGRFMAFRTDTLKEFRMPNIAASDNFYYFENKRVGGIFKYVQSATVYFKNPQNLKEHMRKSSRFQFSQLEMEKYFVGISKEYAIPKSALFKAFAEEFLENPFYSVLYIFVYAYTRIIHLKPEAVLNPIWEVDLSTKQLKSSKKI